MTNNRKTKAEMLQELETLKGLLLEDEDIPLLLPEEHEDIQPASPGRGISSHPSVLPGQASLFDEPLTTKPASGNSIPPINVPPTKTTTNPPVNRTFAKASGENPFLPQHIRQRLHGNNPPPLFEYEAVKKITSATKPFHSRAGSPRQQLIEDVIEGLMPQIETELRHRLFAMSTDELEQLLLNSEE
jgi:hypothetical protein